MANSPAFGGWTRKTPSRGRRGSYGNGGSQPRIWPQEITTPDSKTTSSTNDQLQPQRLLRVSTETHINTNASKDSSFAHISQIRGSNCENGDSIWQMKHGSQKVSEILTKKELQVYNSADIYKVSSAVDLDGLSRFHWIRSDLKGKPYSLCSWGGVQIKSAVHES